MSDKKRKHNPDVQGTFWPMDEFDKPDVDHMTPIDGGVFDDLEGVIDVKNCGCSHPKDMYCPHDCNDCESLVNDTEGIFCSVNNACIHKGHVLCPDTCKNCPHFEE